MKHKDPSRIKQVKTNKEKYGPDHYARMAQKRWDRPGERERSPHLFTSETGRKAIRKWLEKKSSEGGSSDTNE